MNRRAFLAAVAGLAPIARATAAPKIPDDPKAIVVEIYRLSAGKNGKYEGSSAFTTPSVRKRWFSRKFLAAVVADERAAKGEVGNIDFDPVTASQDPSVKNLTISDESKSADNAVVSAEFFSFDEKTSTVVRYFFIREGGGWKLDNMTCVAPSDTKWNLRELLKPAK